MCPAPHSAISASAQSPLVRLRCSFAGIPGSLALPTRFRRDRQRLGTCGARRGGTRSRCFRHRTWRLHCFVDSRLSIALRTDRQEPGPSPSLYEARHSRACGTGRTSSSQTALHELHRILRLVDQRAHPQTRIPVGVTNPNLRSLYRAAHVHAGAPAASALRAILARRSHCTVKNRLLLMGYGTSLGGSASGSKSHTDLSG